MGAWMVWCEKKRKNDLEASRSMTNWRARFVFCVSEYPFWCSKAARRLS
jgi:hypothetical protein